MNHVQTLRVTKKKNKNSRWDKSKNYTPLDVPLLLTRKSFLSHLLELRSRILWVVGVFIAAVIIGFLNYERIFILLTKYLDDPLFYSSPTGEIDFAIQLSILFGVVCAIPVGIYHFLKFIEPTFSGYKKRSFGAFFILSFSCAALGVAYAYFISLPATLNFLKEFGASGLQPIISAQEYLTFAKTYIISFAVLFQIPLILLVFNHLKPLSPKKLLAWEPYVILICFTLAGILTPTSDIFNQSLLAMPPILLYQLAFIWIVFSNTSRGILQKRAQARLRHEKVVTRKVYLEKSKTGPRFYKLIQVKKVYYEGA